MTRFHAWAVAALLSWIATACRSTPDNETLRRSNDNLAGTIQAQQQRINRLAARNAAAQERIQGLQAEVDKAGQTTRVVEEAKQEIRSHVREMVKRFQADSDIKVEAVPEGYRFVLTERVLFAPGSVKLADEGKAALARVADALKGNKSAVLIEGHTDNVPVAKPETLKKYPRGNIELSVQRALAVWEHLVKVGKIAPTRLSVAGYGPNRPRAPNDSGFQRWHNRRVEIHVADPR